MALRTPAFNDAKSYGFEWLRAILEAALQEGVFGAGDLKVTAAAAGGQRVDIAAGQAAVKGDSGVPGTGLSQGLFIVTNDAAIANAATLNASDATNPRLDQIVLRVRDSSDLGSGADDALIEVVTGVPTAGATLDNRNGAAALPNDRLRLADVLVPAASVAVTAANVRDRRPWARGFDFGYNDDTGAWGNSAVNTWESMPATTSSYRLECSGAPIEVELSGQAYNNNGAQQSLVHRLMLDGVQTGSNRQNDHPANLREQKAHVWSFNRLNAPVLVGSHLFAFQQNESGTGFSYSSPRFRLRESLAPNANNN